MGTMVEDRKGGERKGVEQRKCIAQLNQLKMLQAWGDTVPLTQGHKRVWVGWL